MSAFRARLVAPRRYARLHCVPPARVDRSCSTYFAVLVRVALLARQRTTCPAGTTRTARTTRTGSYADTSARQTGCHSPGTLGRYSACPDLLLEACPVFHHG
ncbi:hypothetical protein STRIP9103_07253 [Streptomyces ipomoeae 91-03]|uniref:Uncharacterized protein n=1 Tax=Streptomyces ipomoeae 91-03 TaxID=698759 RepID=L1KNL9_9ACTN|nr:hypothetical protein STRIP9103_07253 [Streptomyces ipomoeae 91-03]